MCVFCTNLNEVNGTDMEIAVQNFHRGSGMCLCFFVWLVFGFYCCCCFLLSIQRERRKTNNMPFLLFVFFLRSIGWLP